MSESSGPRSPRAWSDRRRRFRELLQSVVRGCAGDLRCDGRRRSSSSTRRRDELVFEAIAGHGADTLIGQRFPSSTGIAGWVLVTRQPLVIEDVTEDPRFAKDVAETTGYVPKGLMAVPLLHEERALGVLEVLDRPQRTQFSLVEMDLLGLVREPGRDRARPPATGTGGALRAGDRGRRGRRRWLGSSRLLADAEPGRKEAALQLLGDAVEKLLRER